MTQLKPRRDRLGHLTTDVRFGSVTSKLCIVCKFIIERDASFKCSAA